MRKEKKVESINKRKYIAYKRKWRKIEDRLTERGDNTVT